MNRIINNDILEKFFFNLKKKNIFENNNYYNDKIINLSISNITINLCNYAIFLLKNKKNYKNIDLYSKNDRIFYFGLLLIIISLIIDILIKLIISSYSFFSF